MPLRLASATRKVPRLRKDRRRVERGHVRRSRTPWIAPPPPRVPKQVETFFREVPDLFARCLDSEKDDYEGVIYRMDRPVTPGMIARAIGFRVGEGRRPSDHDLSLIASAAVKARYPDPRPLLLAARSGVPLDAAVRALHFVNPAFPLWDEGVALGMRGLAGRGAPKFTPRFDRKGISEYAKFVQTIAKWREAISFHHVPEEPYFLGRILEGALVARVRKKTE